MGNRENILKVLPSKKFAGATEEDLTFQVTLNDTSRPLIQGDRTVGLNINERFNEERQNISNYRVYGKISPFVDNNYNGLAINTDTSSSSSGFTTLLFQQLYYNHTSGGTAYSPWAGYPQFKEFDMKRKDVDEFLSTTTNWNMFLSYPAECMSDQKMWFQMEQSPTTNSIAFLANQGIPFYTQQTVLNGRDMVRFYCAAPHGLSKGEYVVLNMDDGKGTTYTLRDDTMPVYSLGDNTRKSNEKIFNLLIPQGTVVGFPALPNLSMGTMKRQTNKSSVESISSYYVRVNKIVTNVSDTVLDDCGFEQGVFPDVTQIDRVTPTGNCRVSIKNSFPSYLYSFNKDVDVKTLRDNLGRPLTNLYVTVFLRNNLGYFIYPPKYGWGWNFPLTYMDTSIDGVSDAASVPLPFGPVGPNIVRGSVGDEQPSGAIVDTLPGGTGLMRGTELRVGDLLRGDFCEYNAEELKERVISEPMHQFSWNPTVFNHGQNTIDGIKGYIYKPHHEVPIRRFSTYIEFGDPQEVIDVPDWAEYWEKEKTWRWRDLWEIGFIDGGHGVDYPFMNNAQYPSKIIPFYVQKQVRAESDLSVTGITEIVNDLLIDGCE
jgi:hypothetical protein|tara:strand:- start:1988 stop:3781 length:1794 start_codon:yes stop_codon:yes gene_type:complete